MRKLDLFFAVIALAVVMWLVISNLPKDEVYATQLQITRGSEAAKFYKIAAAALKSQKMNGTYDLYGAFVLEPSTHNHQKWQVGFIKGSFNPVIGSPSCRWVIVAPSGEATIEEEGDAYRTIVNRLSDLQERARKSQEQSPARP